MEETPEASEQPAPAKPSSVTDPVVVKLKVPIALGKEEMLETLTLKPSSRAFRDLEISVSDDGTIGYRPYPLALVGLKMAGHVLAAQNLVDKLHPSDMNAIAQAVFRFFS